MSIAPIAGDVMRARVDEVLNRWPAAGLAVGVVRDGSLAWFHGHGVADVESGTPVDADTRLPDRLDLQDDHGDRGYATVGAGVGRARRARRRLPSRVLAGARHGRLWAGDADAPPPDPYRRRPCRAQTHDWLRAPTPPSRRLDPHFPAPDRRSRAQVVTGPGPPQYQRPELATRRDACEIASAMSGPPHICTNGCFRGTL